jgi:hypothetical protein
LLNPLRSECKRIESELAAAESHTNVIELHPQAVQRFKENLEDLAAILTDRDAAPDLALIESFRALVEGVIVQPRKAGDEYEVRIRGHLAALMGLEVSSVQMVAGGDSRVSPSPLGTLHRHPEGKKSGLWTREKLTRTRDLRREKPKQGPAIELTRKMSPIHAPHVEGHFGADHRTLCSVRQSNSASSKID